MIPIDATSWLRRIGGGSMLGLFLMVVALGAMPAQAQAQDGTVAVTFTVNTVTIPDTVRADGYRLTVNGQVKTASGQVGEFASGETLGWDANATAELTNVGGDYWQGTFRVNAGDTILYKYRWDVPGTSRTQDEKGFAEAENPAGWDTRGIVVTEDTVLPVEYWNNTDDKPSQADQAPYGAKEEDEISLFFRVNVGAQVQTGSFNPETMVVGVRGTYPFDWGTTNLILDAEEMPEGSRNAMYSGSINVPADSAGNPMKFKFVFGVAENIDTGTISWDNGDDAFNPDGDGNNTTVIAQSDSTYAFKFFEGRRPPTAEIVDANVQFAVNVGVLEEFGVFNRNLGDFVSVPGAFNGWDTETSMAYNEAFDAWTSSFNIVEEVGARIAYKYFINWDESRFDEESENFIPNLPGGWEEPGVFGGGDRIYVFTNETEQTADDFGSGVSFFNNIPPQGIIRETIDGNSTMTVTLTIDMGPAVTTEDTEPFDPANDKLYLVVQTPLFGLTQGLPVGDDNPIFEEGNEEALASVEFTRVGETNIFELIQEVQLPTENHIGFTVAYVKDDGTRVQNGDGFAMGRRYYRYIEPLDASDPDDIIWPNEDELLPVTWTWRDLDVQPAPTYGLTETSVEESLEQPNAYALHNNFPNPFNPTTNISFTLPMAENVQLSVYNVLGQRVATLVDGVMSAGTHTVNFNAADLASGVYLYQIRAGSFSQSRTMMLVK